MSDGFRELVYPLGYLSSLVFGGRFMLQWLSSEIQQKSVVTPIFWRLSFLGNLLLMVHSIIQMQFHVCVIQATNGIIAWRNLNLMEEPSKQVQFKTVVKMLVAAVLGCFAVFILQSYFSGASHIEWFGLPTPHGDEAVVPPGLFWHLIGFIGMGLFSSRFWVQWWYAERDHASYLGVPFWWLSLAGGLITLVYFIRIDDPVNIIGPAFGLVPYIRNLMLIKKSQKAKTAAGTS